MLFSEKLRKYALASKESKSYLARESRIAYSVLDKFIEGTSDIRLEAIDKLAEYLDLELVEKNSDELKGKTVSEQLRKYLSDCEDSHYQIAKEANIDRTSIRLFLREERGLELKTVDRLSDYLQLDLKKKK